MASTLKQEPFHWELTRTREGVREYLVRHRCITSDPMDGPTTVKDTPGLPVVGTPWNFGNDFDEWAVCTPAMRITPDTTGEKNRFWSVEQVFSSDPQITCLVDNPLLRPDIVSGSFVKYTRAAIYDRHDNLIQSSSHERFDPNLVQVDESRPTVRVDKNLPYNPLELFASMIDTVNDSPMWGLGPRMVKLSNAPWSKVFYGDCTQLAYYNVVYEFDVNYNTFDLFISDEGTRSLDDESGDDRGDQSNPRDFRVVKDRHGENVGRIYLDGSGRVATSDGDVLGYQWEYYRESNLWLLDLPAFL